MKSLRKTSLDDFFQSNDFDVEDAVRFIDLFTELLGSTLTWCKDAIADALTISREGSEGSEDTVTPNNTTDGKSQFSQPPTFSPRSRNQKIGYNCSGGISSRLPTLRTNPGGCVLFANWWCYSKHQRRR